MPLLGQIETQPILQKALAFRVMGYEVHSQEVADFHNSTAPIRITMAPAQTSKSFSAAADLVAEILPSKPETSSLSWIVGPDYATNKEYQYVWGYLVEQRERWAVDGQSYHVERAHNNPANGNMEISLIWGKDEQGHICRAVIQGKSATNERSLQSEHVSRLIMSEAADQPAHIWSKYLSTRYSKAILPTTPKPGAEWLRDMCEHGSADKSLGIDIFNFSPNANPRYDWERYRREEKRAAIRAGGDASDDPYFAEQFLGRWVYYTGRALPFDRRRHVISPRAIDLAKCQIYVSVDYGYEDPASAGFWAVDSRGLLIRFDEIYERHLSTPQFVERLQAKLDTHGLKVRYATGDPSQPQVARIMSDSGLPVFAMDKNAQRDRAAGHRRLVDLLTEGPVEGYPGLFVTSNCTATIHEWEHLRYREGFRNEYGTTSLEGEDHAFDDARYFVMTRPRVRDDEKPRDWLREAERQRKAAWREMSDPIYAQLGAARWSATGASPYA